MWSGRSEGASFGRDRNGTVSSGGANLFLRDTGRRWDGRGIGLFVLVGRVDSTCSSSWARSTTKARYAFGRVDRSERGRCPSGLEVRAVLRVWINESIVKTWSMVRSDAKALGWVWLGAQRISMAEPVISWGGCPVLMLAVSAVAATLRLQEDWERVCEPKRSRIDSLGTTDVVWAKLQALERPLLGVSGDFEFKKLCGERDWTGAAKHTRSSSSAEDIGVRWRT